MRFISNLETICATTTKKLEKEDGGDGVYELILTVLRAHGEN